MSSEQKLLAAPRRRLKAWMALLALLVVWVIAAELPFSLRDVGGQAPLAQSAPAEETAWGDELLADVPRSEDRFSPLGVANACGLGASSCFKCHNGTRAAAPSTDATKAPWHRDHGKVNYSCAGCHQGNPRLLKQELAHAKLIANPLREEATCTSCHKGGDTAQLLSRYLKSPQAHRAKP